MHKKESINTIDFILGKRGIFGVFIFILLSTPKIFIDPHISLDNKYKYVGIYLGKVAEGRKAYKIKAICP